MNLVLLFKLIVLFSLVESTGQNNNNNYNDKLANDCPNCNIYLLIVAKRSVQRFAFCCRLNSSFCSRTCLSQFAAAIYLVLKTF